MMNLKRLKKKLLQRKERENNMASVGSGCGSACSVMAIALTGFIISCGYGLYKVIEYFVA